MDFRRGPFEEQFGTATGSGSLALSQAIALARHGCIRLNVIDNLLLYDLSSRALSAAEFTQRMGRGLTWGATTPDDKLCSPERVVPDEVAEALDELREFSGQLPSDTGWKAAADAESQCRAPRVKDWEAVHAEAIRVRLNPANAGLDALEDLRRREVSLATSDLACREQSLPAIRRAEASVAARYLKDPGRARRLNAAAEFVSASAPSFG